MPQKIESLLMPFQSACEDPYAYAKKHVDRGGKAVGLMCSYSPHELFHAAGYLPVRIFGRAGSTSRADELLQAFTCSFAKSTLDSAMAGEMDFLSLFVFAHTCDTMQNVADLWKKRIAHIPVLIVSMPSLTEGEAARTYCLRELQRTRSELEKIAGPVHNEALQESIALYARHRTAMQHLYAIRKRNPGCLSGFNMMQVAKSAFLMDRAEHLTLLNPLIQELDNGGRDETAPEGPRVYVCGSMCQEPGFLKQIEEAGCLIIDDDLCTGARSFSMDTLPDEDPIRALRDIYLARRPCSAFHTPSYDLLSDTERRIRESGAEGVIFLQTKFCDPFAFDYPPVNSRLEAENIPTLLLEIEQNHPPAEQFRTRAEAFVELLKSREDA